MAMPPSCPPSATARFCGPRRAGAISLAKGEPLTAAVKLEGQFRVEVASSAAEAIAGADAVLLALPANGHRAVMDAAAPHLAADQVVIVSSHASFGGLYMARLSTAVGFQAIVAE